MIDPRLLDAATTRGILTADQALRLEALARELGAQEGEPLDRERLRFVTGFSDVFVTIGVGLFLGAAGWFASGAGPLAAAALVAGLSWALAELFTLRRRQALPSIALLATFAGGVFLATYALLEAATGEIGAWARLSSELEPLLAAAAAAATAGAVAAHYARFRVPITIAVGAAALVGLVLALLAAAAPAFVEAAFTWLLLAAGLAIFAAAMRFDLADPERATRRADIAFWLHLLAAPMIVHPLVGPIAASSGEVGTAAAVGVIGIVLALGAVAVVVDRRAMLVSGLVYLGVAVGSLVAETGFSGEILPFVVLLLGAFVLALSAGWTALRGALMGALPPDLARRLPRPVG